ncbi:collagen alpha-4(VI) chain-like isoform X2 [Dreissena polymorpha]|uniref:VWFA domain-containing protein n=1 Tax=Dreissena polymorpha TaxID=45954 RepID=A0A9D4MYF2_DREPO|nr:collagen alpha-4(VI) chain-like isoform X2 [Dreissena polymorpha]KAH3884485.1 hypothetical protein DPMN_008465 [Dreissena polymorpha]
MIYLAFIFLVVAVAAQDVQTGRQLISAACGGRPADVFFVLDSSGSIDPDDFRKEVRFTQDVASMFGTDKMRVGVLSFSKTVRPQFGLGEYMDKVRMLEKIGEVAYEGAGTNTAEALRYLHTKGMTSATVRPSIPHIAIVLTDGMSQDMGATLKEAALVHKAGITVFVIGIGSQVDKGELEAIGSRPSSNNVFMIDNFDALNHIKGALAIKACEATRTPDIEQMQNDVQVQLERFGSCTPLKHLDLVFAVDTAAMGSINARHVLRFIVNVSEHLDMSAGGVSIATVANGCPSGTFNEAPLLDAEEVKKDFASISVPSFDTLMRNMRLKASYGRGDSEHIGIIFVNSNLAPDEFGKSRNEMMRARYQKSAIFVIGIGSLVDRHQLNSLVTNGGQYLEVLSFETIGDIGKQLMYSLCLFGAQE